MPPKKREGAPGNPPPQGIVSPAMDLLNGNNPMELAQVDTNSDPTKDQDQNNQDGTSQWQDNTIA